MTTKYLSTHKTADNSHIWKSPYNALHAQYWINAPVNHVCHRIVSLLIPYWFQSQNSYMYFENKYFWNWSDNAADVIFTIIAKISVTSPALLRNTYGWQKRSNQKKWLKICVLHDCHFTYMLDFILKSEYQDNASLSKFKGISRVSTPVKNRVGNSSVSKEFDQLERASDNHRHQWFFVRERKWRPCL